MPAKRSGARRSFLGVRERPGTVLRRRVAVATWPDGSPLTLPILVATGAPGSALYVQGGLHGDEIVGVEAARQIVAAVRPREIRGTLVSVPIANPPAFMSRQRGWPFEARGPMDMNRVCPGDANGPLTARIAPGDLRRDSSIRRLLPRLSRRHERFEPRPPSRKW